MTNDELLAMIRRDYATLEALVGGLSDAQKTAPALDDGWSVKDALAHISAWERTAAGWLEAVERGESPERPEVADTDATNARFHAAAQDRALALVLDESRASHAALVAVVERLSDAMLNDKRPFGFRLWHVVDGNSAEHYREHIEQIEQWLAAGGDAR